MSGSSATHPILRLTIAAAAHEDEEHLRNALLEIASGDPDLKIFPTLNGTTQYFLDGMSEIHLDSVCDRLRAHFQLSINVSPFAVILLDTVRGVGEAEGKYTRQTGGVGNYGHFWLRVEPNLPGKGYEFICSVPDEVLPEEFISAIERGVVRAMETGFRHDRPLVDMKVTLMDGSFHLGDSNESAFEIAGTIALIDAVKKAVPVCLEPVMAIEIDLPQEWTMTFETRIRSQRGRIESIDAGQDWNTIHAIVPLSELLRSEFHELYDSTAEFSGYEVAPDDGRMDEDGPGVTANKPNSPRNPRYSAITQPEPDEEP